MSLQGGTAKLAACAAHPYLSAMGKLIAVVLFVLEVLEALLDLLPYRRMAQEARSRPGGNPIPMHDEPEGTPTEAAPGETGTNRLHVPELAPRAAVGPRFKR